MTGNTVKQFADFEKKLFDKNGGDRSFSILTEQCYDKICPFSAGEQTNIRITHPLHDVHQLADTFLYLEFRIQGNGIGNNTYFLGWRDASQIFKTLRVYSDNAETGYWQRECTKEGLFKSLETSNEECQSRLYESSDIDQIYERESCCGTYLEMKTGVAFTKEFQVIIPITSILAFENMKDLFAPALDITLKFTLDSESIVYGVPRFGKMNKANHDGADVYSNKLQAYLRPYALWNTNHAFNITCTKCICECYGYTVTPSVKQNLFNISQYPLVIPCRKLEIVKMPDKFRKDATSYVSVIHHALDNVSQILIMPDWCKARINYTLFQLYIAGQVYPSSDYMQFRSTDGEMFTGLNDNHIRQLNEHARFAAAYVRNLNPKGTIREGILSNIIADSDTYNFYDFTLPFQLKRNTQYDVYDGWDSNGTQVPLEVRLQTEKDMEDDLTIELWLIRDCCWILDARGLRFVNHPGQELTGQELGWLRHRPENHKLFRNAQH